MNIVNISLKLKLSINTIKKRIKNLEKNKIILNYRLLVDSHKIGYEHYKLHINLKYHTKENLNEFRTWIETKKFVIYTDHYINGADFEIELHLKTEKEYINFIDELNKRFGKIIQNHFLIKFHDIRIYRYLPKINK